MDMLWSDYTLFNVSRILIMLVGGIILKKYVKKLPESLIPLVLVFWASATTFIFFPFFQELTSWEMRLANGPICGLAAVGLHQLVKQTKEYYRFRKMRKALKEIQKSNIKMQKIS